MARHIEETIVIYCYIEILHKMKEDIPENLLIFNREFKEMFLHTALPKVYAFSVSEDSDGNGITAMIKAGKRNLVKFPLRITHDILAQVGTKENQEKLAYTVLASIQQDLQEEFIRYHNTQKDAYLARNDLKVIEYKEDKVTSVYQLITQILNAANLAGVIPGYTLTRTDTTIRVSSSYSKKQIKEIDIGVYQDTETAILEQIDKYCINKLAGKIPTALIEELAREHTLRTFSSNLEEIREISLD